MHSKTGTLCFLVTVFLFTAISESTVSDIPSPLNAIVNHNITFQWNSTAKILEAIWGIRSGRSTAKPQYIFVDDSEVAVKPVALDANPNLKKRLHYIGNLAAGRAWFRISNATVNDSNSYIAMIREDGSTQVPYYVEVLVSLTEKVPTTAPTTVTVTTTKTSTPSPSTPTPTPPAPSKNYIVRLNGTINITKENEPSDVERYIGNRTNAVFRNLPVFHNVTVEVYKQSSIRFIINLTLWFDEAVNESTIRAYVGILLDRINNTSQFSSSIFAMSIPTSSPTPRRKDCTTEIKVGCAIGLIIAVVIIVVIGVVIYRKKKEKKDWATWEKVLVVIGFIVAIVIIIVTIVVLVDKCT